MLDEFVVPHRIPKSIASQRLMLRQYRVQDWEENYRLYQESYEGYLSPWSPPSPAVSTPAESHRSSREHILLALEKWDQGTDYRFFIVRRDTEEIVGQLGISQVTRGVNQSCSIGYWIGKRFASNGYATEALVLALQFAFEELKLHRVTLWISPKNDPSLRVAEKVGLRFEGTALRALFLGGCWQDTHIFAMTSEEWPDRKEKLRADFAP